jgi:hypothetical protein
MALGCVLAFACTVPLPVGPAGQVGSPRGCGGGAVGGSRGGGSSGAISAECAVGGEQQILLSNYDTSCKADSDCMAIFTGDACYPCGVGCPTDAINKAALSQYMADIEKTKGWADLQDGARCDCPLFNPHPCCVDGACATDDACSSNNASADAASDAAVEVGDAFGE